MPARAVVLLSGGLDSATVLAVAREEGYECFALSFDYGQRHARELQSAKQVAASLGAVEHLTLRLDLRAIGGSALTDDIEVPKGRSHEAIGAGIPVTYVPARNTIFLSHALAWAETLGSQDIFIGVNALDYSVSGNTTVWIRGRGWARPMTIEAACNLPHDEYETIAVNPSTLDLEWRRVTGRFKHPSRIKRCFALRLERGRHITVTEDHSLFTIDPDTAHLTTIKGSEIVPGTPLVVPFDLSGVANTWEDDLRHIDVSDMPVSCSQLYQRQSIRRVDGHITNRLRRTLVPVHFPITDDFLYVIGLWIAEGGKSRHSKTGALSFSIGGLTEAVDTVRRFFGGFGVSLLKSPENDFDYCANSSVLAALFRYMGLFGTAKRGEKAFPTFFWNLSQRQRRIVIAALIDGDGSHVFKGECTLAQKSHEIVEEAVLCLSLDGIFPIVRDGQHGQKLLVISRAQDFRRFVNLYPFRHASKRASYAEQASLNGRDQASGLWKCPGLWNAVASAKVGSGVKTRIYNDGGKHDASYRARREAFLQVEPLQPLVKSRLAFLRVVQIEETRAEWMYDLGVEGVENFLAAGVLAHNSGYPDCRPEFIEAFERLANLATRAGVEGASRFRVHTPLITLSKAQIVARAHELGVNLSLTWSCYEPEPDGRACGRCDSCLLRKKGFAEARLPDPVPSAH
jgi:7-cyano-7-deazaguanine synthase in queuosine biosynthesis